ncbi:hypothetical protein NRB_05030 [Novosphingobium sp. 11B]
MILTNFSPAVVLVGAGGLAALLFALHRLRVRRQVVRVATAMFWRMAAAATPPRMLHERFRHVLAYLLALAIVLALWVASAGPRREMAAGSRADVFYLDASAGMTAGAAFDAASRSLLADAAALPAERRSVRLGDLHGTVLLAPGEDLALLPARLAKVHPGVFPSAFPEWFAAHAQEPAAIHYYGLAASWNAARGQPRRAVSLVAGYLAPRIEGNRGIVALGAVPAASGAWDKADVLVEAAAADAPPPGADQIALTLNGEPFAPRVAQVSPGKLLIRDVSADGAELVAALRNGDGFAADDRAGLRLPQRHRIRVAVLPGTPDAVSGVIAADPALVRTDAARAEVILRGGGASADGSRPALVFGDARGGSQAFHFVMPDRDADQGALADTLDQLGLARFDAAAMADRLGRPIGVDMAPGRTREISVWRELFTGDADFSRSPAMPLFVSQAVRWLASQGAWVPYAHAGRQLVDLDAGLPQDSSIAARGLGEAPVLGQAGKVEISAMPLTVSLTDRATTRAVAEAPSEIAPSSRAGGWPLDLPFLGLLLLAGVLLVAEWVLFQRGWMP